jgi:hypothetical protein
MAMHIPFQFTQITSSEESPIKDEMQSRYEHIITISIPESKLDQLLNIENMFYNNIDSVNHRRLFETWCNQQAHERELRKMHPGIQESYDQYRIMVELCRERPKTFNDTF